MSTDSAIEIAAAERRAEQAKARLTDTVGRLQIKLQPKNLAREAYRSAGEAGEKAAYAAARNPAPVAGAVAVTGLFLFRHRIARLFRRDRTAKSIIHHSDRGNSA